MNYKIFISDEIQLVEGGNVYSADIERYISSPNKIDIRINAIFNGLLTLSVFINFQAESDKDATSKVVEVLNEAGFDWCETWVLMDNFFQPISSSFQA